MNDCNWEIIAGFHSPVEYRRFYMWIESQIAAGAAESVPVGRSNVDAGFGAVERWFKCKGSGEIWRLIAPESPARGFWGPVE